MQNLQISNTGDDRMPKVSVIMPAYNAEKYIAEAIDSILNQTFADFEFIIIDDGSKDNTVEIVKSYSDKRIRFYQNEHNMGVAATLNRGIELATGEYIARMDSDDISLPERFEKQIYVLDNDKKIAVCAGNAIVFSKESQYITQLPLKDREIKYNLFISSPFVHPSVMIRKSVLDSSNIRYESEFDGREDYRMWMKISLLDYKLLNIDEPVLKYRIHTGQVTQKKDLSQIAKHTKLKKWYLDNIGISYTDSQLKAICSVSVGEPLDDFRQLIELKTLMNNICLCFNETILPDLFVSILINEISKSKMCKNKFFELMKDQPARLKIKWLYQLVRS